MATKFFWYLTTQPGTHFVRVTGWAPAGVEVNLEKETWTYKGSTTRLGHSCRERPIPYDSAIIPLGVYDAEYQDHVERMVHHAQRFAIDMYKQGKEPPG